MNKQENKKYYGIAFAAIFATSKEIVEFAVKTFGKIDIIANIAPDVKEKFMKTEKYQLLRSTGAQLASICPLMYTNNPVTKLRRIMTTSNKLRTYSVARYYKNDDMLRILVGKGE